MGVNKESTQLCQHSGLSQLAGRGFRARHLMVRGESGIPFETQYAVGISCQGVPPGPAGPGHWYEDNR
jgi:hypothetical protein